MAGSLKHPVAGSGAGLRAGTSPAAPTRGVRGAGAETPAVACTVCEKVVQAGLQPSDAPPPAPRNAVFLGLLHARPGGLSLSILPCGVLDAPARPCGRVGARRPVAGGKTDRGRMAWAAGPWGALSPPPGHRRPSRASRSLRLRPLRRDEVGQGWQRKWEVSRILFLDEIGRGCRGRLLFPYDPGRPSGRSGIVRKWRAIPALRCAPAGMTTSVARLNLRLSRR